MIYKIHRFFGSFALLGLVAFSMFPLTTSAFSEFDVFSRIAEHQIHRCYRELTVGRHGHIIHIPARCPVTPPPLVLPTLIFSASTSSIMQGTQSILSWTSTDAFLCVASDGWNGNKALTGTEIMTPSTSATYTLSCGNAAGTTTKQATISVQSVQEPTSFLGLAIHPSSPAYQVVAGGTTGVTTEVIRLRATGEDESLSRVTFKLSMGSTSDIKFLRLYDGFTQVGIATFTGENKIVTVNVDAPVLLANNTDHLLTARVDLSLVGVNNPGVEGDLIRLNAVGADAIGTSTHATIHADWVGEVPGIRLFKSYPVFSLDTLPSTGLTDNRLLHFKVTATNAGPVGIAQFNFIVATSASDVANVQLFAFTDSSYSSSVSSQGPVGQVGNTIVNPASSLSFKPSDRGNPPLVIPAGSTFYFELRGAVTGTSSSISTTLKGDNVFDGMNTAGTILGNIIWSPNAFGISAVTDADWTNAFGVPGLPSIGITQTRSN